MNGAPGCSYHEVGFVVLQYDGGVILLSIRFTGSDGILVVAQRTAACWARPALH